MFFDKKDLIKLTALGIVIACAVCVCNMFLNYYMDLAAVETKVIADALELYKTLKSNSLTIIGISGGSLIAVSIVMIVFFIGNFISTYEKEIGTLKALGYSSGTLSVRFWIFGLAVLLGALIGYALSFGIMPSFYAAQNEGGLIPEVIFSFHGILILAEVALPALLFTALSVLIAYRKLQKPALSLIRGESSSRVKKVKNEKERPFVKDMAEGVLKGKPLLLFFAIFAPFCYGGILQMGISMGEYTSELMSALIICIGLIITVITVVLFFSAIVKGNEKNIAMMRVMGYSDRECRKAVLDVYRPYGYFGFAIGTVYTFALLFVMVNVVFGLTGSEGYAFDWKAFLISFCTFVPLYELTFRYFAGRVKRIPIKQIMTEQ